MTGEVYRVVVMGVSGSGIGAIGERIAAVLGTRFLDAEALHAHVPTGTTPDGFPLGDDDRWPWLDLLGEVLAAGDVVVSCSALRRAHRDRLRAAAPGVRLVYLEASARRTTAPLSPLVRSQVAILEAPGPDEDPIVIDTARMGWAVSLGIQRLRAHSG